jgi:hypothetical protein
MNTGLAMIIIASGAMIGLGIAFIEVKFVKPTKTEEEVLRTAIERKEYKFNPLNKGQLKLYNFYAKGNGKPLKKKEVIKAIKRWKKRNNQKYATQVRGEWGGKK